MRLYVNGHEKNWKLSRFGTVNDGKECKIESETEFGMCEMNIGNMLRRILEMVYVDRSIEDDRQQFEDDSSEWRSLKEGLRKSDWAHV